MFIGKSCAIIGCMKNFTSLLITFILIFVTAFSFAGCAENADATIEETEIPDYATICQQFEDYRQAYSTYRDANDDDVYENTDGYTTDEIPCSVRYIEANNGTYKIATLEASREIDGNELIVVDEYYAIDENTLFIVRMYSNAAGMMVIEKRVVINNVLYFLDDDAAQLVQETRPDSFDLYLSFDEITSLYGGQS